MKNFKGFTLAEVLITLGIIGVVAAITMPVLIQNYQKQVTVTQIKKAYSEFAQALQKAEAEHGLMETWDFADFTADDDTPVNSAAVKRARYFGENYLFPHIKTIKQCFPTSNECWADGVTNLSGLEITDSDLFTNQAKTASFISASGYTVYYWLHGTGTGMWYAVDVNGFKKPNRLGHDIFAFQANWGATPRKKGVYPAGMGYANVSKDILVNGNLDSKAYNCKKSDIGNQAGAYCTAVIMLDGWKIEKDYPW